MFFISFAFSLFNYNFIVLHRNMIININDDALHRLICAQVKDKGKDMKTAYKGLKWKGAFLF